MNGTSIRDNRLLFTGAGRSDTGRVRSGNEDSGFLGPRLALVADGVGGAAAGEVASATTAYVVSNRLHRHLRGPLETALTAAVLDAQRALAREVHHRPEHAGLATTLTAVATDGARVVVAHAGDSRGYLLRGRRLSRFTRDHTFTQALVDQQRLTPARAAEHPWCHVVTRSINATSMDQPELSVLDARPGDRILLCSDGLTDLVDETRIAKVLGLGDPALAADRLVRDALVRGGRDNVTCLILDVGAGPSRGPLGDRPGCFLGAATDSANIALPSHTAA